MYIGSAIRKTLMDLHRTTIVNKIYSMKSILLAFILLLGFQQGITQKSNKPKLQEAYDAIKDAGIEEPDFVISPIIYLM